jgi:hypothetical protein
MAFCINACFCLSECLLIRAYVHLDSAIYEFTYGGGARELMSIVKTAHNESFKLKALEHLAAITFEGNTKQHTYIHTYIHRETERQRERERERERDRHMY